MFVGRNYELDLLNKFKKRTTAGLIVCRGRRRIGKSTLIQEFGKKFQNFYEFYGLAPRENISNKNQLQHFGELMGNCFNIPALSFDNWTDALITLAELTSKGRVLILLDEISWIGSKDKDFAGKLKGVWDTRFKKNNKLILVLCGSVTSWIDKNILNDKGFMGRVSLTLTLEELPLNHANQFWKKYKHISFHEKFKMLSITGGVPRYLEEIIVSETSEENIKKMCFSPEGLLYTEFDKIFIDIFDKRSDTFKKIVKILANGPVEQKEIAKQLGKKATGNLSDKLSVLVESGFVSRDFVWSLATGRQSRKSKYRLKDNYLRFYLKYIDPEKDKIQKGLFRNIFLENLKSWDTIMGLQVQNLVLNNLTYVLNELNIAPESLISASPYFQKKTRRCDPTQIDLLIDTRYAVYICEIKYRKTVDYHVIHEMEKKIDLLKNPKKKSIRTVLIYLGKLTEGVKKSGAFTHYLPLEKLLA
jgi:hypothetical protein